MEKEKLPTPNVIPAYDTETLTVQIEDAWADYSENRDSTSWDQQKICNQAYSNLNYLLDHWPNGLYRGLGMTAISNPAQDAA